MHFLGAKYYLHFPPNTSAISAASAAFAVESSNCWRRVVAYTGGKELRCVPFNPALGRYT